jgi:hypothetical protein
MSQEYKNGKIAGMMLAARFIQEQYENPDPHVKLLGGIMYVRDAFAKECQRAGFDMWAYLRGNAKITVEV